MLIHKKKLLLIIDHFEADSNGCYVLIHGFLYGEKITILNVYAAPDIHPSIFTNMTDLLPKYSCSFMIWGGELCNGQYIR